MPFKEVKYLMENTAAMLDIEGYRVSLSAGRYNIWCDQDIIFCGTENETLCYIRGLRMGYQLSKGKQLLG